MPLEIATGYTSAKGKCERNEDYCSVVTPEGAQLAARGAMLAVADGMSGGVDGAESAEYCVRGLLADYYATPDTWEVSLAIDRVLAACNRWLLAQGAARRPQVTMATTLSVLVLRGGRYHFGHVGDTRIYLRRAKRLIQLTHDHVWDHPQLDHVLKRAIGLDEHLVLDHGDGALQLGDRFLLCSDGVWSPLGDQRIDETLELHKDPQRAAEALVKMAVALDGHDNASAIVVRLDAIAPETWRDIIEATTNLPVPPRMQPGTRLDDFQVQRTIHESRATLLYEVKMIASGRTLVMKTLQPILSDDKQSREGLLAEEWLTKRLVSIHFPQVIPLAPGARTALYYVMTYHAGATLQQHLDRGRHFTVAEVVRIGTQLTEGLSALHRLSILHRDIKPANLMLGEDDSVRILDMGVALAVGVPYPELESNPGTPSFMAPELFEGESATVQSDLYAAGVSLYHLLTRKYPYGEVEPFQHKKFGDPTPPTRYRPDVPHWLENLLLRAIAPNRAERFETAEELLLTLQRGEARGVAPPSSLPLLQRGALARWQAVAAVSIVVNLLLLYVLLVR
jgi:protein phosphatase